MAKKQASFAFHCLWQGGLASLLVAMEGKKASHRKSFPLTACLLWLATPPSGKENKPSCFSLTVGKGSVLLCGERQRKEVEERNEKPY